MSLATCNSFVAPGIYGVLKEPAHDLIKFIEEYYRCPKDVSKFLMERGYARIFSRADAVVSNGPGKSPKVTSSDILTLTKRGERLWKCFNNPLDRIFAYAEVGKEIEKYKEEK